MAVESREEQIVSAMVARYRAITAGTTYWYTPSTVLRDWRTAEELTAYPAYSVIEGELQRTPLTLTTDRITLPVTVVGWVHGERLQVSRRVALTRCVADLLRATYQDETWGGLALVTRVARRVTDEGALVTQPLGYLELELQVLYVLPRGEV